MPKLDPKAPVHCMLDNVERIRFLQTQKPANKPIAGGVITEDNLTHPKAITSLRELKAAASLYQQGGILKFEQEKDVNAIQRNVVLYKKIPKMMKSNSLPEMGTIVRKEAQDLFKYMKGEAKKADKCAVSMFKLLEKDEVKQEKRELTLAKVAEMEEDLANTLREARRTRDESNVFEEKYMTESKLGMHDKLPKKEVAFLIEQSAEMAAFCDESRDDLLRFFNTVFAEEKIETFNLFFFAKTAVDESGEAEGGITMQWQPTWTEPSAKKGLADAIKWITKNMQAKGCAGKIFWPHYQKAFDTLLNGAGEDPAKKVVPPQCVYLICSRAPEYHHFETLSLRSIVKAFREEKNKPLPIKALLFDPIALDKEKSNNVEFFNEFCGEAGSWQVDTTRQAMVKIDQLLMDSKRKRVMLEKTKKQLEKMEDLSEAIAEKRKYLKEQLQIFNWLENDQKLIDLAVRTSNHPDDEPLDWQE